MATGEGMLTDRYGDTIGIASGAINNGGVTATWPTKIHKKATKVPEKKKMLRNVVSIYGFVRGGTY